MYMSLRFPGLRDAESPLGGCLGAPDRFDERADARALDPARP